jgi:hypothetical protein
VGRPVSLVRVLPQPDEPCPYLILAPLVRRRYWIAVGPVSDSRAGPPWPEAVYRVEVAAVLLLPAYIVDTGACSPPTSTTFALLHIGIVVQ